MPLTRIHPLSIPLLAAATALLPAFSAPARAVITDTFDDPSTFTTIESGFNYNPTVPNFRFDYGTPSGQATHSATFSTQDASGAPGGSVQVSTAFNFVADGAGGNAYTIDLFPSPTDANTLVNVSFDLRVDPASATDAYGGVGYFAWWTRNDSYTSGPNLDSQELGNETYSSPTVGTWQHFSESFPAVDVRALTFQLYNSADRNINGNVILQLDNLTLTSAADTLPEPAAAATLFPASLLLRRRRRPQ